MKKLNKRIALVLTLVFSVMIFAGCTGNSKEGNANEKTITVEDQLGRKVEIKGDVNRIISSYYVSTSILIGLGLQDKVVGIEKKAKNREMYEKCAPEFLKLPAVGTGKEINVEECIKLKPDLVIIPTRLKKFIPDLEKVNIKVIAIEPENLDSFMQTVELIGKATGANEKANKFLDYYKNTLDKVSKLVKETKNRPTVYLGGTDNILKTCTGKMYQNYMIEESGGTNVTKDIKDGYWANISVEQLIKFNPEVIYVVGYAKYTPNDVLNDERLKGVEAIKNKKVYIFPSKLEPWDFPTPSSILGMLWILQNIHSDVYSTDDFKKDAKAFYKEFYNLDVSDEEIGL